MFINYILLALYGLSQIYFLFLLVSVIISWIPSLREFKIFRFIDDCAGWYLDIFRGRFILGFLDCGTIFGFIIYETVFQWLLAWII